MRELKLTLKMILKMKSNFSIIALATLLLLGCSKDVDLNTEFTSITEGCGEFGVYKFNSSESIGIAVYGDSLALDLSQTEQTFDLATTSDEHISVVIKEFNKNNGRFSCWNFDGEDNRVVHKWYATSGQVTIRIVDPAVAIVDTQYHYSIDVSLKNLIFEHDKKNNTLDLDSLDFLNVIVGDY
jgi:hypothetical protein